MFGVFDVFCRSNLLFVCCLCVYAVASVVLSQLHYRSVICSLQTCVFPLAQDPEFYLFVCYLSSLSEIAYIGFVRLWILVFLWFHEISSVSEKGFCCCGE